MYTCTSAELIMTVMHGQNYDTAHVEYLFSTNAPIPQDELFFVPGIELMPKNIMDILKLGNFQFVPIPKTEVVNNLNNYLQEVQEGKKDETLADSMIAISTSYMNTIKADTISPNSYRLKYDYAIYPETDGNFIAYATLPLKGFTLPAGSQTRFVTILPLGAKYDPVATKGKAINNPDITEHSTIVANGITIIDFFYQNDPDFTVKYRY